ncbi:Sodium/hydrogen exchanger [Collybia nuda]|uniref:Sodium/hydrogen exchanger n=1 Tax=Collybia nuda TaxID=64659 RepID=A0A9P5YGW9_9AGAR|nr:Sodium/hydrogen exchanger [Collybia nuda]
MTSSIISRISGFIPETSHRLSARAVVTSAGVIAGENPAEYSPNDPFKLWVIQLVIIIGMSRLCYGALLKLHQPRAVAELLGGIILGPTIMGRIPGFTATIFPEDSIQILNLCATIGLTFFLFFAGLELDLGLMKRHLKAAIVVSAAGLLVPFAFGYLLAFALYREFLDDSTDFALFALFVAIAICITAIPIVVRMLAELGLFDTALGVVVIGAGMGNDILGWILLALAVALSNASNGLVVVYMILTAIAYVIVFLYPVRWFFTWLARWTGSLETGKASPTMMIATLVMLFISAFFTDIIGLHAIFGAFIAGLIVPHDNGLSHQFAKQLEDVAMNIFLPIYFTLSGLKTDLSLLNNGKAWGFTIVICAMSFASKFAGCAGAAKYMGFNWRESSAIGTLMTCKGLLELIVINLGLQSGILTPIMFAMFVFHALLLTFITAPLTTLIIPKKHLQKMLANKITDSEGEGPSEVPSPEVGSVVDDSEKAQSVVEDSASSVGTHRGARQN